MRVIRLHIVLAKGQWGRCIKGSRLKSLLDNHVIRVEVQKPDADVLYDFILTYALEEGGDNLADDVYYALVCHFQPEYESMVEVSVEEDSTSPLALFGV